MVLPNWDALPVRTKRSRKRLYTLLASELSLTAWKSLPNTVKRSKIHLYNYIASQKNLEGYDELAKNNMRSTRLLYTYIKENASGSKPTLKIKVKDGEDNVSGATVTIGTTEKTTDANGEVEFELEYGDYTATISAEGYATVTEELAFRSNHKNFEIELESSSGTGTVTVTCQKSDGTPLVHAGVTLYLDMEEPPIALGRTDSNGTVTLETVNEEGEPSGIVADVPYGDYILTGDYYNQVSYTAYSYEGTLTVDGNEEITITLTEQE